MNPPQRKPGKRNAPGGGNPNRGPKRGPKSGPKGGPNRDNQGPPGRPRNPNAPRGRQGAHPHAKRQPPPIHDPRTPVMELLRKQAQRWPDLELVQPQTSGLSPRDAAFAHALYDQCIRRWLTCRFFIERHLSAPWQKMRPEPKAALLAGTAQLLFMRSVPAHAAVNESVEWTRNNASRFAAGLVNAVLRRIAEDIHPEQPERPTITPDVAPAGIPLNRTPTPTTTADDTPSTPPPQPAATPDTTPPTPPSNPTTPQGWQDQRDTLPLDDGTTLRLADHLLPEDPVERLAVATSHPVQLLNTWIKSAPMREVRERALHGIVKPPVILNTQTAKNLTDEDNALLTPHRAPGHHVFKGSREQLIELLHRNTTLWAQDPASSLAVQSVIDLTPELVVDYCAGNGTKTRQLAAVFPNATIIATDIDRPRADTLAEALEGIPNATAVPFESILDYAGKADLVLLDVPCSNSGVLARRVEARYRASRERTQELAAIQRQIIADAIRLLRQDPGVPQGKLLYSTCSLDPTENQDHAAWAKRWHAFEPLREHTRPPTGLPGDPPELYSDGSYAVLLA